MLMLMGGAAPDETSIGSRLNPAFRRQHNADMGNPQETMYRFIECTSALNQSKMREFLDTLDETTLTTAARAFDQHDRASRCATDAYVGGDASQVNFGSDRSTMRGMVAESFLRKDAKKIALAPVAMQAAYTRDWYAMTGRPNAIDQMATCVADVDPQNILALTKTEFSSKKERKVLDQLMPEVGKCLQAGAKLNTNQLGLRTAMMEALYHRVYGPAAAVPAK